MCERSHMNAANHGWAWWVALMGIGLNFQVMAQPTNISAEVSAGAERSPQRFDESSFRIVAQRNIFNANRSGGGQVRGPSRRPSSVEYFALVGTMDYEKGSFAFFEGSNSQFTKVMKASEVIAGHKLVEISADSVKLEADSKQFDLPVGSQMRREDEGAWQLSKPAVVLARLRAAMEIRPTETAAPIAVIPVRGAMIHPSAAVTIPNPTNNRQPALPPPVPMRMKF